MKRYSLHYSVNEPDPCIHPQFVLGQYDREWGYANSQKALRGDVLEIARKHPDAHDFRIYDHAFDDSEPTAYEHLVCHRESPSSCWINC